MLPNKYFSILDILSRTAAWVTLFNKHCGFSALFMGYLYSSANIIRSMIKILFLQNKFSLFIRYS